MATTFFASKGGILAFFGIGTAATPIGWIIAAAIVSGGAYYSVTRLFRSYSSSRVDTIPKFINTPLDVLGATLIDLIGALAVGVGRIDGVMSDGERAVIAAHFIAEWGFDAKYVEQALTVLAQTTEDRSLEEVAGDLAALQVQNPDCNPAAMTADLIRFLREIVEVDGGISEREDLAIKTVEVALLSEAKFSIARVGAKIASWGARVGPTVRSWMPTWGKS